MIIIDCLLVYRLENNHNNKGQWTIFPKSSSLGFHHHAHTRVRDGGRHEDLHLHVHWVRDGERDQHPVKLVAIFKKQITT